ncbi:hypothetical protein L3X38_008009 [Prunus dulcis]|uniref:Uncharacterized protein n=1 Tax=Prunus dulcis TaxID=3755 RepID=A0AAD5F6L4_PRUDU|nr:hypothetical protein L3X38_008009 [Prunus dulcis]
MFSPMPFSLVCTVLLCLPLTIIFTITRPTATTTTIIPTQISQSQKLTKTYQKINLISLPKSLQLDDDSLFLLAARVNSHPPRSDRPKIAFLFLTITILPFSHIWERFFNQTPKTYFSMYVHANPRFTVFPRLRPPGHSLPTRPTIHLHSHLNDLSFACLRAP